MEMVMTVHGALEYFHNDDYIADGYKMKLQAGWDKCYPDLFEPGNVYIEHWELDKEGNYEINSVERVTEEQFKEMYMQDNFYVSGDIYSRTLK